ncbi:MAG: 23S rRNA (pseudouridine(1915)-N(3))-methyltransferase RlmH [Saprospiraceae bacterium]|nr:23S rRNA (pseudouridine(1915)-N(3))-methyltransferase RlmH [Saprospiraceae bacterium]
MKVELWLLGNTSFDYIKEGVQIYEKRLKHYLSFSMNVIPDLKNRKKRSEEEIKQKEGEAILKKLQKDDWLILLDERGKQFSSLEFATYMEQLLQRSSKRIVFLIGGAYGFSKEVYNRANAKISLSKMTFSHQMVRLFVIEQIYRAMAILHNLPYHHE